MRGMSVRSRALLLAGMAAAFMDPGYTGPASPPERRQSIFNATLSRKEWKRRKRRLEMTKRSRKANR